MWGGSRRFNSRTPSYTERATLYLQNHGYKVVQMYLGAIPAVTTKNLKGHSILSVPLIKTITTLIETLGEEELKA